MLLKRLNASGKLHMVPASLNDRFVIRFCVCAERATDRDISIAFDHIRHATEQLLSELKACTFPLMFFSAYSLALLLLSANSTVDLFEITEGEMIEEEEEDVNVESVAEQTVRSISCEFALLQGVEDAG